MKINISGGDLLRHLSFWHNKTDDECVELATNEYGVDAEQALLNILERDLCTNINNSVVDELKKFEK
jgi:hypothetical protein